MQYGIDPQKFFYWTLLLCLVLLPVHPGLAASLRIADNQLLPEDWAGNRSIPPAERIADNLSDDPWILNADQLTSHDDGIILEASGNIRLEHGEDYLEADFARYFPSTDWIYLSGNIRLRFGSDLLEAEQAELNLESFTGWLTNGKIFLSEPHLYLEGNKVTKHWGDNYSFVNATITACDGPNPAWSLSATAASLELDGYAILDQTSFLVYGQRILYAPTLVIPAKVTRQSGFLIPEAGYSSLNGFYFSLPYYKVLSQSRDLTFNLSLMSRGGILPSLEYRSQTADDAKTWLALDLTYASKTVLSDTDDKVDAHDGLIRGNHLRWWLRGMGDGELGAGWNYRYNLDLVSDQNFLREYQSRISGFNENLDTLRNFFGRGLRPIALPRLSQIMVFKDFGLFNLAFDAAYTQDPALGHGNAPASTSSQTQIFPRISLQTQRLRPFPKLPLEVDLKGDLAWMFQRTGQAGLRLEVQPRLVLALDLGPLSFLASANLRQAFYAGTRETRGFNWLGLDRADAGQTAQYRFLPELKVEAFTQLARIWPLVGKDPDSGQNDPVDLAWTRVRHLIQPRLSYHFQPDADQSTLPHYVADDRLPVTNMIYLDLANIITIRQENQKTDDGGELASPGYFNLFRLDLGLGYNFAEAARERNLAAYPRQPFTDLKIEARLNLTSWLDFWTKSHISLYGHGLTLSESGLTLNHPRWGNLNLVYAIRNNRYNYQAIVQASDPADLVFEDPARLVKAAVNFRPTTAWNLGLDVSYDLDDRKVTEGLFQIGFTHQCYRISGGIRIQGAERSYFVSIALLGFS